jgi:N-dimethylarginine dimethylaminohydrolase
LFVASRREPKSPPALCHQESNISSMPRRVLLCPPTYFEVRDRKNPYMREPIDRLKAQRQWEALCDSLRQAGLEVETIAPVKNLEDMVFAANQVFVGHHSQIGNFIVPSEMRHPSRQREVPYYVDWFSQRGYRVLALNFAGEFLEGHGDLIWHPDHSRIWAGYGFRSTLGGVEKFAAAMNDLGFPVTPLQLVDPYCYHLDTCFCPLNPEAVLIFPGAFSPDALASLAAGWKRIHKLSRDEAIQFIANGIVANGYYIAPRVTPQLTSILQRENLIPLIVDTSEFERSGGSAFCMKTFLD